MNTERFRWVLRINRPNQPKTEAFAEFFYFITFIQESYKVYRFSILTELGKQSFDFVYWRSEQVKAFIANKALLSNMKDSSLTLNVHKKMLNILFTRELYQLLSVLFSMLSICWV